jgi:hypothetical protein
VNAFILPVNGVLVNVPFIVVINWASVEIATAVMAYPAVQPDAPGRSTYQTLVCCFYMDCKQLTRLSRVTLNLLWFTCKDAAPTSRVRENTSVLVEVVLNWGVSTTDTTLAVKKLTKWAMSFPVSVKLGMTVISPFQ